ncbi:hypothetical protein Mnod_8723 (plasmid) [Methylobacterium nodulans ORS 2060]|uniref:Uncharacterized protein n=1 Tax=Methylobacterium nodulans (strain LMG 21967 / CNCM I-2342 / ORS 2060) TaxID=460265 RepID=B8IWI9_METNO|nr:hypothetical protein Mnod_8723 [Methylobacterium nodulans ORS 2060]
MRLHAWRWKGAFPGVGQHEPARPVSLPDIHHDAVFADPYNL